MINILIDHSLFSIILRIQLMVKTAEQIFCERSPAPGKPVGLCLKFREHRLAEQRCAEPLGELVDEVKLLLPVIRLIDHIV